MVINEAHDDDMASDFRSKKTGRYTLSKMDRPCACGHTLGAHAAGGDRECINREVGDGTECQCAKFKAAK